MEFLMKKVIFFLSLLLLAASTQLIKSNQLISSVMSIIPTTPLFFSHNNNPLALGIAGGTFVASAITNTFGKKSYNDQPTTAFGTVLTSINKINTFL